MSALGRCLPLYMAGFRLPAIGSAIVAREGLRITAVPLILYLAALSATALLPIPDLLLDLAGIGTALVLVGLAQRHWPAPARGAAWLGRRTLPIYLLHFPIIAALGCGALRWLDPLPTLHPAILVTTPLMAALAVALSLLLHQVLQRAGGGWLFALPGPGTLLGRSGAGSWSRRIPVDEPGR